jgi:hypothetical protein
MVMHLPPRAVGDVMPSSDSRFRNRWPMRLYKMFKGLGYPLWESHTHLYRSAEDSLEITYFTRKLDDPYNWCWRSDGTLLPFNAGQIDHWTDNGVFNSYKASARFDHKFSTCGDFDSFTSVLDALLTHPGPGRWSVHFEPNHQCSPRKKDLFLLLPSGGNFVWYFEDNARKMMVKLSATVTAGY